MIPCQHTGGLEGVLALNGGGWSTPRSDRSTPPPPLGKGPGTHCTEGCVGPKAGLKGRGEKVS